MRKKGIIAWSMFGVLALGVLYGGAAFAVQTCTTDGNTGQVSCTNSATASVTVSPSCTFERFAGSGTYVGTLVNGTTPTEITGSTFNVLCNDSGGYAVYAVGYSNDELSNTKLVSNLGSDYDIQTAVYDSSAASHNSSWAMKLTTAGGYTTAVINNASGSDFTDFHVIPSDYTMVASANTSTLDTSTSSRDDPTNGSKFTVTYQAYASNTQPAGTYNGAVKYTMVHPSSADMPTINDLEYLQDFAGLSVDSKASVLSSMAAGTNYTLKDKRDNQEYTVAKLADGKVWMTKNLNLAGDILLSSSTTDFVSSYSLPTDQGWQSDGKLPASSASGFSNSNYAYVYNSNSTSCGNGIPCYSYYSWDAATLGSGREIATVDTDAQYSICPKGWRLPTSGNTAGNWKRGDLYALATAYGANLENSFYDDSADFYDNAGPSTPVPNFLLTGQYYDGSLLDGGSLGYYWSSTSYSSSSRAENLSFGASSVSSANDYNRSGGFAVRCIAR